MGWDNIADSSSLFKTDEVRAVLQWKSPPFASPDANDLREKLAPIVSIVDLDESDIAAVTPILQQWAVVGRPLVTTTAAELRTAYINALNEFTWIWDIEVGSIQLRGAESPIEVPTTTAISIAALAVIAVVGWLLYKQLT